MAEVLDILVAAPSTAACLDDCLLALEIELSAESGEARAVTFNVIRAGALPPQASERYPHARWIMSDAGTSLPALYGRALNESSAVWIAFLDADCPVRKGWLKVALSLCAERETIFGGAVEPGTLASGSAWAAYFCDYGAFLPPLPRARAYAVPGNNLLLRRSALSQAPVFAAPRFWKTLLVNTLLAHGVHAVNAPNMVIRCEKNQPGNSWLRRRFDNGRCFAAMRLANASWGHRALRAAASAPVPLILLLRLLRDTWPRNRYRAELIQALPWIAAGLVAWAAGECVGIIRGAGLACERVS